jgi:hypothetical protein
VSELSLRLEEGRRAFAPGDRVRGTATWSLRRQPTLVEVRLYWKTVGKGTTDLQVVDVARAEAAIPSGERRFEFRLPETPYSFSGRLVSVVWAVELVVEPTDQSCREEIVVAPGGRALVLPGPVARGR